MQLAMIPSLLCYKIISISFKRSASALEQLMRNVVCVLMAARLCGYAGWKNLRHVR